LFCIEIIIIKIYILNKIYNTDKIKISYFSMYFSMAMPDPKIISDARNNFGFMSVGYFIIKPIKIEKIPSSCSDFAM